MEPLALHEFHQRNAAAFTRLNGPEAVADYGDWLSEYVALRNSLGLIDLGFRGRLCLTGQDRIRFLHGQVTNDISGLRVNAGCYAALTNAKARMVADLNVYRLADELLLDTEPGLSAKLVERLEKYIIADDVQILDVSSSYGQLRLQGPRALECLRNSKLLEAVPENPFDIVRIARLNLGETYVANRSRKDSSAFELFAPTDFLEPLANELLSAVQTAGGRLCGWTALEMVRMESGRPRFGVDIDESTIPLEAGLESEAISFKKGCYIGQEIISRIRTYSEVAKSLRRIELPGELGALPVKGDLLVQGGKEVGYLTSAVTSPALKRNIAFGYIRKEVNQIGEPLTLRSGGREMGVRIVGLPFEPF